MIVLSFLLNTFKLIFKLPVLLCLGIVVFHLVGMIRGIYSLPRILLGISCTCICHMSGNTKMVYGMVSVIVLVTVSSLCINNV